MVGFNPRDPAFIANPYPAFRELRESAPVWRSPFGRTFLTRYEDASLLMRDRRLGKDYTEPEALIRRFGPTAMQEPAVVELSHMMLMRDPPDHTRLRGLVTKVFTARKIEEMRPGIQAITDQLLDKVAGEANKIRRKRIDHFDDGAGMGAISLVVQITEMNKAMRWFTISQAQAGNLNPVRLKHPGIGSDRAWRCQ